MRVAIPALAGLAVWIAAGLAPPARGQDLASKVDESMQARVKLSDFSGSILIGRKGEVLVAKGYGLADRENDVPCTPETKFRLGSITKQFTGMAVMILQERGKLSADDRIAKYLDDCPEAWKDITLRHLLTHASGIPNFTNFPDYDRTKREPSPPMTTIARFRDKPLDFAPGESMRYSNSGYVVLGAIVEKASGQPYGDFLRASIFEPLGMHDTGYDRPETILKHRARGYARRAEGVVNADYLDMSIPHAAGALYSTVGDLHRWSRALDEGKLVSKESAAKIFTPFKDHYAYGWVLGERFGKKTAGHGGGIDGFVTQITRFPDDEVSVIVLSNLETSPVDAIDQDLGAIAFGRPYELPRERTVAKVDPATFDAYVGKWELDAPKLVIRVFRDGDRLMSQAEGQGRAELFPESPTKFFLKVVDAQLEFLKDDQGQVTGMVLNQGGQSMKAHRLPTEPKAP